MFNIDLKGVVSSVHRLAEAMENITKKVNVFNKTLEQRINTSWIVVARVKNSEVVEFDYLKNYSKIFIDKKEAEEYKAFLEKTLCFNYTEACLVELPLIHQNKEEDETTKK